METCLKSYTRKHSVATVSELTYAEDRLVFPESIGESICIVGEAYIPMVLTNGDTHKQLLARSRYLLFKSSDKWTDSQRQRAEVLFETYPDLKETYSLKHSLRMIFSRNTIKDAANSRLHAGITR